MSREDMKIKILKDGPYMVTGNIPLYEKEIVIENGLNILKTIRKIETEEKYMLCRCGKSNNKPFCDGMHSESNFDGTETALKSKYLDRASVIKGEDLSLYDDERCAFARFCHKKKGDVWTLTEKSSNEENKNQAIEAASQCPSGRLTSKLKNGKFVEYDLEPSISIITDPNKGVLAGIYVTGNIAIESADGETYEVRNRVALCRCGNSENKPFCDAIHVSSGFNS